MSSCNQLRVYLLEFAWSLKAVLGYGVRRSPEFDNEVLIRCQCGVLADCFLLVVANVDIRSTIIL